MGDEVVDGEFHRLAALLEKSGERRPLGRRHRRPRRPVRTLWHEGEADSGQLFIRRTQRIPCGVGTGPRKPVCGDFRSIGEMTIGIGVRLEVWAKVPWFTGAKKPMVRPHSLSLYH